MVMRRSMRIEDSLRHRLTLAGHTDAFETGAFIIAPLNLEEGAAAAAAES